MEVSQGLEVFSSEAAKDPMAPIQLRHVLVRHDHSHLEDLRLALELIEARGELQVKKDEVRAPRRLAVHSGISYYRMRDLSHSLYASYATLV